MFISKYIEGVLSVIGSDKPTYVLRRAEIADIYDNKVTYRKGQLKGQIVRIRGMDCRAIRHMPICATGDYCVACKDLLITQDF